MAEPIEPSAAQSPPTSTEDEEPDEDEDADSSTTSSSLASRKANKHLPDQPTHHLPPTAIVKPKRVILLVGKKKKVLIPSTIDKVDDGEKQAEWVLNGAGKMDVRGFRELRI